MNYTYQIYNVLVYSSSWTWVGSVQKSWQEDNKEGLFGRHPMEIFIFEFKTYPIIWKVLIYNFPHLCGLFVEQIWAEVEYDIQHGRLGG